MALAHNPKIVTEGLLLCLDAANQKSYSNSGTTWGDLSGNNNDGTLVNGVDFDGDNNGSLVFNGSNQRIEVGNFSTGLLTLSVWLRKTSQESNQGICRKERAWALSQRSGTVQVAPGSDWKFYDTGYALPLNTWTNVTYCYKGQGSDSQALFVNGLKIWENGSATGEFPSNSNQVRIAFDDNGWWWGGNISSVQIYDRPLSSQEIYQNYSALKGRYGL